MITIKYNDPLVLAEAAKYKKVFETYDVNAGSYIINGNEYFMANYLRWKHLRGCAVISPNSTANKREFSEAFDALFAFAQILGSILENGGKRGSANMSAYYTMKRFLSNVLHDLSSSLSKDMKETFEYCLSRTETIIKLQEQMLEIYQKFARRSDKYFEGSLEYFTKKDLEEATDHLGEMDYIQYRQLLANYESIPKFKYIRKNIDSKIKKYTDSDIRLYLAEFSKNEKRQLQRINNNTFQPNMRELTKDEYIEEAKKDLFKNIARANDTSRRELRYP